MWNGPLQIPAGATSTLYAGNSLKLGDALYSNNGGYKLTLQPNGNLVLRSGEKELWTSGTAGQGVDSAALQGDGNFVLYTAGGNYVTGTGQNGAVIPTAKFAQNVSLTVDDTGNVLLYDGARVVLWETRTSDGQRLASEWTWWRELHSGDWASAVTGLVPVALSTESDSGVVFQDGLIVGLENGAIQQWAASPGQEAVVVVEPTNDAHWTELEAGMLSESVKNSAAGVLADTGPFTCAKWQCSTPSGLKEGIAFATAMAGGGFAMPTWGESGGIGSDSDPIFGKSGLKPSPQEGTIKAFAFYKKISPDAVNYKYPNPSYNFEGYISLVNDSGDTDTIPDAGDASILYVKRDSIAAANVGSGLTEGIENVPGQGKLGLVTGYSVTNSVNYLKPASIKDSLEYFVRAGTTIGKYLDTFKDYNGDIYDKYEVNHCKGQFCEPPQHPGCNKANDCTTFAMQITKSPNVKVGLDIIPVAYGFTYVPDGFFPKFTSSNWSFGVMAAVGVGPSIGVNLGPDGSLWGVEKTLVKKEFYNPTPYGAVAAELGVKVGANLTVNGLAQKSFVGAYAYVYGGAVATFNTVAKPGSFQFGFNWSPDISAADFYQVSGLSVTGIVNPYAKFSYGLFLPQDWPLVGGWSLAKVSLGYENPISATVCVDTKASCPVVGGAGVANVYGVINGGTFTNNEPGADKGDILTVTKNALFNPTTLDVGQRVTGQGVAVGTTIKEILPNTEYGDQYRVEICESDGSNCATSNQAVIGQGEDRKLAAYLPGSDASITFGASGLLTFHAGALETFTKSLSYDTKLPLYSYNKVVAPTMGD